MAKISKGLFIMPSTSNNVNSQNKVKRKQDGLIEFESSLESKNSYLVAHLECDFEPFEVNKLDLGGKDLQQITIQDQLHLTFNMRKDLNFVL